jgi:c-di-GMP-binding flagellar brake protein YcgR
MVPIRSERYSFDSRVTLTIYRPGQKHELWGRTADISQGGVAVTLSGTLEVGETVSLRIEIERTTLNVRAVVRHRQGHFCGLEFLAMTADQREIVKSACKRLRPIAVMKKRHES